MNDRQLDRLLNSWLDGSVTGASQAELEAQLLASPAARDRFWQLASLHGLVHEISKQKWGSPELLDLASSIAGSENRRRRFSQAPRLIALAASLLLVGYFLTVGGLLVWDRIRRADDHERIAAEQSSQPSIQLTHADDARWRKDSNTSDSANRTLQVRSGLAELKFPQGAKVVVEGPAEFEVRSTQIGFLKFGKLVARVPHEAIGFTVTTPTATIVDLGTEFAVEVAEGETSVQVFEGVVKVSRNVAQKSPQGEAPLSTQQLRAGEAARTTADGIVAVDFASSKFTRRTSNAPKTPLPARQTRMIDLKTAIATQSSDNRPDIHSPQMAIDGDRETASHTAVEDSAAWLQIDLGATRQIAVVVLNNRPMTGGWLRDITVKVIDADGKTIVASSPKLNPKNRLGGGEDDFADGPGQLMFDVVRKLGEPAVGRYVRIEREACTADPARAKTAPFSGEYWLRACKNCLSLNEVQIFDLAPSSTSGGSSNKR